MISVSPKAVNKMREILQQENKSNCAIRVGIKGGGCSGFTYILDFEEKITENDQKLQFDGVDVVIDNKSIVYLAGTELDFTDGLNGAGFVFKNPNASRTCGCGSSFAV